MDNSQYASPYASQNDTRTDQRGWFGRNWLWFVPTILGLPLLMCCGCCGGLFVVGINALQNAPPYVIAQERIQADPQITAALGEPIEVHTIGFNGQYNEELGHGGSAVYRYTISGPNGSADVHFEAYEDGGTWVYDVFDVRLPNGETVSLTE